MRRPATILALLLAVAASAGHVTAQEPAPGDPATDPTAPLEEPAAPDAVEPPAGKPDDAAREAQRRQREREREREEEEQEEQRAGARDEDFASRSGGERSDDGPGAEERAEAERRAAERRRERRRGRRLARRLAGPGTTFPVWRADGFDDTFGADRQIGAHQGNDVFAPFGAPVLAVADGVVEKVGTLPISGNRLWLRTPAGDEFFYAHLAAFSPQAVNGRRVAAGTVLGFVGSTGDAETTAPHVHFEIHPRGRDGAADPYPVLRAWEQQPPLPATAWLRRYGDDTAARPGALLPRRDYLAAGG